MREVLRSVEPPRLDEPPQQKAYIGGAFIRHQPKNSLERVQDNLKRNRWLDPVPNPKPLFKLRRRVRSKEISGDFRFAPRDRYQRMEDTWNYQKDYLDVSWSVSKSPNKSYYKTIETIAYNSIDPALVKLAKEAATDKRDFQAKFKVI